MEWDALETSIGEERWSRALSLATDGWRKQRLAVLADLVDLIALHAEGEPIVVLSSSPSRDVVTKTAKTNARTEHNKAFHAAWMARAASAKAIDIGPLLSTLTKSTPLPQQSYWPVGTVALRYAAWLERMDALSRLPDDPRMARVLFEIAKSAPWLTSYSPDAATLYDPVIDALGRIADERLLPDLETLQKTPIAQRLVIRQYLLRALPRAIEAVTESQSQQRLLESFEIERCEKLIDRLGGRQRLLAIANATGGRGRTAITNANPQDEAALFDLVLESLEDDGPREVLADFWLERQDPRGQFITLSLNIERGTAGEADRKTYRALLREHEKVWLGVLALVTKGRVYARGFLDHIELMHNAAAESTTWETAPLHPALATVRSIEKGKANERHYQRFIFSPSARSLQDLTVVTRKMLLDVCARKEPWTTIHHLALQFMPDKRILKALLDAKARFPALTKLTTAVTAGNLGKLLGLIADFTKAWNGVPDAAARAGSEPHDEQRQEDDDQEQEQPRIACVAALPLRWSPERALLAKWLSAVRTTVLGHLDVVELCGVGRHNRICAHRSTTDASNVRIEIIADSLFGMEEILTAIERVEHVLVRVPDGVEEIRYQNASDAARLFGTFPQGVVETDAIWSKHLSTPAKLQTS